MSSPLLPSQVTDKEYLRIPNVEKVVNSDEEWQRCGKWTLFTMDAVFADRAWSDLCPLVFDGPLLMVKASTARMKEEGFVLICYTRPGKEEARRAAVAIRRAVDFKELMHYKLNKLTDAGIARRHGHKGISTYMHTYLGRFYVRDRLGLWVLDDENRSITPISRFRRENYAGSETLPSQSEAHYLDYKESIPFEKKGESAHWSMLCDCGCSHENDTYLPEADRVWIVAKELVEEGVFKNVSYEKRDRIAQIRFYVPDCSEVCSMLVEEDVEICDRIFEEASVKLFMFFSRGNGERPYFSYKYSSEGELRKVTENVK